MTNYTNQLNTQQTLNVNDTLTSNSGAYQLILQSDGNLCVYEQANHVCIWASGTSGKPSLYAIVVADGGLEIVDSNGSVIWDTGTFNAPYPYITMQDDGNLVLYCEGYSGYYAVWASNGLQTSSTSTTNGAATTTTSTMGVQTQTVVTTTTEASEVETTTLVGAEVEVAAVACIVLT